MTILQTERLFLRPCRPDDRTDFIALEADPDVMRYLNGGHVRPSEEPDPSADYLMPRGTEPHVWTGCLRDGGAFVGWFCLWPDKDDVAELGYRLKRAFWGRGLASEGARALAGFGFATAGYRRITATTMAANLGSRGVMEKIGMRHVRSVPYAGASPIPGSEAGEVWYEMDRADFSL